jgi:hypothetical protein
MANRECPVGAPHNIQGTRTSRHTPPTWTSTMQHEEAGEIMLCHGACCKPTFRILGVINQRTKESQQESEVSVRGMELAASRLPTVVTGMNDWSLEDLEGWETDPLP